MCKRLIFGIFYLIYSTAYKNISEAISSAHNLAIHSKKASVTALEELYPKVEESVIEKGFQSLQKSHDIRENAIQDISKLDGKCPSLNSMFKKLLKSYLLFSNFIKKIF